MTERRTRMLVGGLLMLLAAVAEAIPQTAQSRAPTMQVDHRKTRKSENNGSSSVIGTTLGAKAGLCFQPGVGWQRILPEPATQGAHGSIGPEVTRSTSAARAPSIYVPSSSTQQAAECAGNPINKTALGTGVGELNTLDRHQTMRSSRSTKPGTVASIHVHSPYRAPAPTYLASEAESDAHPDVVGVHAFHAYTSSIKLRRLIRNAPDFRTRTQLQQLQNGPAAQPHKARTATKTVVAAREPLLGERPKRTSSRRSDTHDRPHDNSRKPFSGVYR